MSTNNPNLQQVILQPMLTQQTAPKKKLVAKPVGWSKTTEAPFNAQGRTAEVQSSDLIKEVRENLSNLRCLNSALMLATYIDIPYKEENKGKEAEYKDTLTLVNDLSRKKADETIINELKIISDALSLDRAKIDAIFPQIIYNAVYMNDIMTVTVDQIRYEDFQAEAKAALKQIATSEEKLTIEYSNDKDGEGNASINDVVQIINAFNEMKENKKRILALKKQDQQRAKNTLKNVLIGMSVILASFFAISFALYLNDIDWAYISKCKIALMGIPLSVIIWSFIGSFAAMLTQFNKKKIYEFGNSLKWIIIRPVLGVVMGAAIYMALLSLVLTGKSNNEYLPLVVAFFVGYSDTFTLDIMNSIQRVVSGLFSSSKNEEIKNSSPAPQPVYVMAPQQATVHQRLDHSTDQHKTQNNNQPETIKKAPDHNLFAGEDEA